MYPGHDPLVVDVNVPSRIDLRRAAGVIVSVSVVHHLRFNQFFKILFG
jgi:hypothetical protein